MAEDGSAVCGSEVDRVEGSIFLIDVCAQAGGAFGIAPALNCVVWSASP